MLRYITRLFFFFFGILDTSLYKSNPLLCGDNLSDDKGRLYTNDKLHFIQAKSTE